MKENKPSRAKFFSKNLNKWVTGTIIKENDKTVWLELPSSYKVVIDNIPISTLGKISRALLSLKTPQDSFKLRLRKRVLDDTVPAVIKKKKSQVVFL